MSSKHGVSLLKRRKRWSRFLEAFSLPITNETPSCCVFVVVGAKVAGVRHRTDRTDGTDCCRVALRAIRPVTGWTKVDVGGLSGRSEALFLFFQISCLMESRLSVESEDVAGTKLEPTVSPFSGGPRRRLSFQLMGRARKYIGPP